MAKKKKKEEVMEEDDWFDDDEDWEEEKPKKKKAGKGKKKDRNTAWIWVLAFIVILAILLLVRYKYAGPSGDDHNVVPDKNSPVVEPKQETKYVPESEMDTGDKGIDRNYDYYEGPRDIGNDVVTEEEIQTGDYPQESIHGEPTNEDIDHARDITDKPELFSNINCEWDYEAGIPYISLRIYNTLDEDILISPKGVAKGYNTYFMIRGIVDKDPGCGTEVLRPGQYTECRRIGFDGVEYGNTEGVNRISVEVPKRTEALLVNCPKKPENLVVPEEE